MTNDGSLELDLDEVDIDLRAEAALDEIRAQRNRWARLNRRPPALRPREALQSLLHEGLILFVANPADASDRHRMTLAYNRIHEIVSEVIRTEGTR